MDGHILDSCLSERVHFAGYRPGLWELGNSWLNQAAELRPGWGGPFGCQVTRQEVLFGLEGYQWTPEQGEVALCAEPFPLFFASSVARVDAFRTDSWAWPYHLLSV